LFAEDAYESVKLHAEHCSFLFLPDTVYIKQFATKLCGESLKSDKCDTVLTQHCSDVMHIETWSL